MQAYVEGFLRERRRWWLLIAFWAAISGASYAWRLSELQDHAYTMARQRGQLVFETIETTRLWASQHGGVYAPVTEATPPNPYLDTPEKVITTPSGKQLTKINPAYMTRQLGELLSRERDLNIHLTSLKPINPGNAPDDWEREALTGFERERSPRVSIVPPSASNQSGFANLINAAFGRRVVSAGETAVFRYMAPLEVKAPCLACHAKQGYQLGDVRGGLSVTFPASYVFDIIDEQKRAYLLIHLAGFMLMSALALMSMSMIRHHILAHEATRNELAESEKMASLGRMVAGFAHEVNTPIGVAVGATSQTQVVASDLERLIAQEEVSEADLRSQLALLHESSALALSNLRRAAGMVQSFKRTAVDQGSDAARDYHLAEVIDDVRKNLHNQFKRTSITLEINCPDELRGHGKVGALEQVLTNLMDNARLHAFADGTQAGTLRVLATREQNEFVLTVSDDGTGMRDETVSHIFEPFFTTRRGQGGSGLGLYIVYSLVTRELGGSIIAHSQQGIGTRFVIRFPIRRSVTLDPTP